LALVSVFYGAISLVLIRPSFWFEWDETVNISQVSRLAPPGPFTAPRARGMPWLLAPVTDLTTSTIALRVYLVLLSSVGLYLAFRPWLRLRPGWVVPGAAFMFSTLWVALYYGFEAMPNFYVAIGVVAAVAHFLLAAREPHRRRDALIVVAWLAFVALIRPTDAVYAAVPLLVCAVLVGGLVRRRRTVLLAAVVGGVAIGWIEWAAEAFAYYGGLSQRLRAASAENDSGLHFTLVKEARALTGPTLCRGHCSHPIVWPAVLWWFVLAALVVIGLVIAHRRGKRVVYLLPTAVGLAVMAEYVFTIDYAAARFLLPGYALLALPAAEGVAWLCSAASDRPHPQVRRLGIVLAVVAVGIAHMAVQAWVLETKILPEQRAERAQYLGVVRALRALHLRHPCDVVGYYSPPIAYGAGCASLPTPAHRQRFNAVVADGRTTTVFLAVRPASARDFAATWPVYRLQDPHLRHAWYAYVHRP